MKTRKTELILLISILSTCQTMHQKRADDIIQVTDSPTCNHEFRKQTFGILTTPFYPLGYPDGTACKWIINMQEGLRVVLSIKSFVLGPFDSLVVREETVNATYTQANPPDNVIFSTGNEVIVELHTEKQVRNSTSTMAAELVKNRTFHALFEKEGCGGLLTKPNGYITVPVYIHISGKSHECSWTILGSLNQVIILEFLQFDLPPGSCLFNNIYIREGDKNGGYVLGDFCEENPPYEEIRSSNNIMYIAYRTRPSFLAQHTDMIPMVKMFYKTSVACGGSLKGFSGAFATPTHWIDNVYLCNWTIEAPREKHISIKFQQWIPFEISQHEYDEVKIATANSLLWSSKGDVTPPFNIRIPSNKVTVSLISHRNRTVMTHIRFHGVYQAVKPDDKQCVDVGYKQLYMCDDWQYIDCSQKCNGIPDCDNFQDETNCPIGLLSKSIVMQHQATNHHSSGNYAVLFFAITGILMVVATLTVVLERFYRGRYLTRRRSKGSRQRRRPPIPGLSPPPYAEHEVQPSVVTHASTPPPPYSPETEHSEDTDGITQVLQVAEFQLETLSSSSEYTITTADNPSDDVQSCSTESTDLFHDTNILSSSSDVCLQSSSSLNIDDISTDTDSISEKHTRQESNELKTDERSNERSKFTESETCTVNGRSLNYLPLDDTNDELEDLHAVSS